MFLIIGIFAFLKITSKQTEAPPNNQDSSRSSDINNKTSFDKNRYSLTEPTSIWVVVNKKFGIDTNFEPELIVPSVKLRLGPQEEQMQISKNISEDIQKLFEAAKTDNINLVFGSGFRSSELQRQFYESYKSRDGQDAADTYSARPGHSEHQTGLSADITSPSGQCHLEICWEDTPEGKWLKDNSYKYGFIIRYPKDKQDITGYQYEPWHIRFVGIELATKLNGTNKTLEEFFDLVPSNSYEPKN